MADLLLLDQREQTLRVATLVFTGYHQFGTTNQGREDIQQRGIETDGRELQYPTVHFKLHMGAVPGVKVAEIALAEQHAFWLARGA
ncbi:hypothetical protein D3C77_269500 [compost metagenome]